MNFWKAFQELPVVLQDGRYASLLQHDFGNPNAIWIAGFTPWQLASICPIPGEYLATECCHFYWIIDQPSSGHVERILFHSSEWITGFLMRSNSRSRVIRRPWWGRAFPAPVTRR